VLAHGIVDNISAVLPSAPLRTINGGWSTNGWQVQFSSAANWSYALEKTEDLTQWRTASETVPGTGGTLTLNDPASQPTATHAFYRVRAEKR
jgi:hypothetical protein